MSTYYVSTSGNDSTGDGSIGNPWLTLIHANSQISGGDTVYVGGGTYTFDNTSGNLFITASGTDDTHRTRFVSIDIHGAHLVNNITPTNVSTHDAVIFIAADYVDIEGFEISGASARMGIDSFGTSSGSGSPLGSHNRVRYNSIHDLGTSCNPLYTNVSAIDFTNDNPSPAYSAIYNEASYNIVNNVGQAGNDGAHGIYFGTARGTIQNNIVSGVPGYGINMFHFVHHMQCTNNLVFNCGFSGAFSGGIYLSAGGSGFVLGTDEPADFCVIANNIIAYTTGRAAIYEEDQNPGGPSHTVANNTFTNNCYYKNATNFLSSIGSTSTNEPTPTLTGGGNADTFTRANQSGWGTASGGDTWNENSVGGGGTTLSIVSNQGKATNSTTDNFMTLGLDTYTDAEVLCRIKTSSNASGNWQGVLLRWQATNIYVACQLRDGTGLYIERDNAGSFSHVAFTNAFTWLANTEYWIRFNATGTTYSAKAWPASGAEPGGWTITGTDATITQGLPGIYVSPDVLGTDSFFDSFSVTGTIRATNPAFVNYQANGSGDYHVQAGSICIDAGASTDAPLRDLDGTARPRGAGFDIGPYEYLSSGSSYLNYKNTIEPNLVAALNAKGLLNFVQLIGPDTTMANDAWLTSSATDLSSTLSGYVRHAFPTSAADISNDSRETAVKALVTSIYAADNTSKPIIQGEMGFAAMGPGQSVALFAYGLEMADYAVQLARSGMAALIAYDLDDDMHGTQWGFWQITTDTGVPRPWFFPWSLLSTTLVPGSQLYAPVQPTSNDLRVLAALSPSGAWTFVLVNRKSTAQNVQLSVPFAHVVSSSMQAYTYSNDTPLLIDGNGFPLASGTVTAVLPRGFTVSLGGSSLLILSQATAIQTNLFDVQRPPLQRRR